jgi:hypothetical protein
MTRHRPRNQAANQTLKVACKPTAATASKSGENPARAAQRPSMKSSDWTRITAKRTEQRKMRTANYRFEAYPSLQFP